MKDSVLEKLIQDLVEGGIDPHELVRLEAELISNPQSMSRYLAYQDLNNLLEVRADICRQLPSPVVPVELILKRQKLKTFRTAMLSAAALVLLTLVAMNLFFVDTKQGNGLTFESSPGTEFTLTHSVNAEAPTGLIMEKGSRLQLSQGTVELTFKSGVKSVIMAPADLTLNDSLYLKEGTAWFQVPKGAEGFMVRTRELDIVDLGTEFGVLAKADDYDEVHVLKGRVQVTARRDEKESTILTAGQAREVDLFGRLDTIPAKESAFLTSLPESIPHLHWSFDQEDGFQVKGSHPAVADITTTALSAPTFTEGKHGSAISLDGITQHLETDWNGFAGNRPRTVSFWLKLPVGGDYKENPGIVGWGDRTQENGKWKITLANQDGSSSAKLQLSWGSTWLTSQSSIQPGQWQHITVTSNGELNDEGFPHAEFYMNGTKQAASYQGLKGAESFLDLGTTTMTHGAAPLMIGSDLYTNQKSRNLFRGQIDELFIFDGHMTELDVKKLITK